MGREGAGHMRAQSCREDLLRGLAEVPGKGMLGTMCKAMLEVGTVVAMKRLKDVTVSKKEFRERIEGLGAIWTMEALCLSRLTILVDMRSFLSTITCPWEVCLPFCMPMGNFFSFFFFG